MTEPYNPMEESPMVKWRRSWAWFVVVVLLLLPVAGCGGDDPAGDAAPKAGQAEKAGQADKAGQTDKAGKAEKAGQAEKAGTADKSKAEVKIENLIDGSFVGEVEGTNALIAIVAAPAEGPEDQRKVQVYIFDGERLSEWFSGSSSGNSFSAKSDGGDAEAKGKLSSDSVTGTVELPDGKAARYEATRPAGAAGLYDLTVSRDGELSGASAAGVALKGEITLERPATGVLKLADGQRLTFDVTRDPSGDVVRLQAGQLRVIVLPGGQLRGAGRIRPSADGGELGFFIRSSST